MLRLEQYQKLKLGDQIRFSKDVYTVKGHQDFGSHVECKLVSDEGVELHNGIYVTHLMAYHGAVEMSHDAAINRAPSPEAAFNPPKDADSLRALIVSLMPAEPENGLTPTPMSKVDQDMLSLYLKAEMI
jgi:hypothetical protein